MLLQFNFSNHKSFREEASLDLTATGIGEYSNHIFVIGNEKILPVTAIYGANASGKSNLIDAFIYMHYYVFSSFGFDADKSDDKRGFVPPPSFSFDKDSKNKESTYEVYFIDKKVIEDKEVITTYNYGFTVNEKGVAEEWLNTKAKTAKEFKTVFYRNENEGSPDLSGIPKKQRDNITVSLGKRTLILSLGARLKVAELEKVYYWFAKNETDFSYSLGILVSENKLPRGFADDKNVQKEVVKFLSTFDTDIIDFEVNKVTKGQEGEDAFFVETVHNSIDSDDFFKIPLHHESSGTLRMFSLYQCIKDTLKRGAVLVLDELNASLHPVMLANIIKTFTDKETNPNGAQLIFTTHDATQLDSSSLRRDEIWFTEKVNSQSQLYSLADFEDEGGNKIRKDENYRKNYLVGKYGAIPHLKQINFERN